MFKVECPGCKAPYQVDERRVPASGLKMRCPKCGTSFQVDPPPADPRAASLSSSVLGASLGFSGDAGQESVPPPVVAGAPRPALPKRKPALKGTMIGVAPPRSGGGAPARPAVPAAAPAPARPPAAAPDPFGELDLPAAVAPKPAAGADPFSEIDLPSPAAAPAVPPRRGVPARPQAPAAAQPPPPRPGAPPTAGPPAPPAPRPIEEGQR